MTGQKYFFDLNNFDQPTTPEVDEDLPPPPPVFSEEELANTRQEGFAEGRIAGIEAEKQSRANYIAAQVSSFNTEILGLVLAEQMREKRFEREVVSLCRNLVGKLFPQLALKHGFNEIEAVISKVISTQATSIIRIEVPTADVEEIYAHLLTMKDMEDKYEITGAPDLEPGCCRMKWQDGGALRDQNALTASILQELDDVLALSGQKGQNNESDDILKGDE